jgi:hypothetical protein
MRHGCRAWVPFALLAVLGRAAAGAAVADEAPLANQPGAVEPLALAPPVPIAAFPSLALQPNSALLWQAPSLPISERSLAPSAATPRPALGLPLEGLDAPTEDIRLGQVPGRDRDGGSGPRAQAGGSDVVDDETGAAGAAKLFDGGGQEPRGTGSAEASFEERALRIRAASTFKFSTGPRSRSVLDWRQKTIDGLPAEEIGSLGRANAGVYRYSRDGRRRVLKILTQTVEEDYPEDYPDYPAEVQLRGGAVGSVFGAPRILRTGTIRNGRYEDYFIEMEELFPGTPSRAFKDALRSRDKAAWVKGLSHPGAGGVPPVVRIARMIVEVMEHGVVPYDGDILVTEDGRVAWIDANFWAVDESALFPAHRDKLLRETNHFLRSFAEDPATGRIFAREFLSALKRSRRIPDETKDAVLKNWVERDAESLKAVGLSGPAALRSFYDGLGRS